MWALRARRSGVDRHVCNVKATGSNPVESILVSLIFFKTVRSRFRIGRSTLGVCPDKTKYHKIMTA
jgi:hypothetical protein